MRLRLLLHSGSGDPIPLLLELADDATVAELSDHLASLIGSEPGLTIDDLERDALVRDVGPRSGSTIVLTTPQSRTVQDQLSPVTIHRSGGAPGDSIEVLALRYGQTDLDGVTISVTDHIEVVAHDGRRILINGSPVIGARRVTDGDLLAVFDAASVELLDVWDSHNARSTLAVGLSDQLKPPERGPYAFHRPAPRIHDAFTPASILVPTPPDEGRLPGLPILSSVVPLLFGAALWAVTRSIASAVFVLFSFMFVVAAAIEARSEQRKEMRFRESEFRRLGRLALDSIERSHDEERQFIDRNVPCSASIADIITTRDERLWERHPADQTGGFLRARLGSATRSGITPIPSVTHGRTDLMSELNDALADAATSFLPVTVDLSVGGGLGLIGAEETPSTTARWIVLQLAALTGPDELQIVVVTSPKRRSDWIWTEWLPHSWSPTSTPHTLVIVDGGDETEVREALAQRPASSIRYLWVTTKRSDLPRSISQTLTFSSHPTLVAESETAEGVYLPTALTDLCVETVSLDTAERLATQLCPLVIQHVLEDSQTSGPNSITLVDVVAPGSIDSVDSILRAWRTSHNSGSLNTPIARSGAGSIALDLTTDGPHGLVAGTTGAGKSELLRTWLVSMALHHSPSDVTFLLVDYKGGSAFGPLVDLPHCVGLITDLDESLARRASVSLRAELKYRESWLADIGIASMSEAGDRPDRPPALVIAVDEFATLAKEIPAMVDELVDVAQRGRSLGIHLILATQRPHGVVSDSIRANTSIRIALRVADREDSTDVIDSPDAASIPGNQPGSAIIRVGQARSEVVQCAYSSAPFGTPTRVASSPLGTPLSSRCEVSADNRSQMGVAVQTVTSAFAQMNGSAPRPPWVSPLADIIDLETMIGQAVEPGRQNRLIVIGRCDRPDLQRTTDLIIDLEHCVGTVVFGCSGSGRSTALSAIAESTRRTIPECHVYSIGNPMAYASDSLDLLDRERVLRLLRLARDRCEARDTSTGLMILIDDIALFENTYEDINRGEPMNLLSQLMREGSKGAINIVIGASRRSDIPITATIGLGNEICLRVVSQDEAAMLGAPPELGSEIPQGRGMYRGHWVQIALPRPDTHNARRMLVEPSAPLALIPALDPVIALSGIDVPRSKAPSGKEYPIGHWRTIIGLDTDTLAPAVLDLDHCHALIAGPRRSGRSTALRTIASSFINSDDANDGIFMILLEPRQDRSAHGHLNPTSTGGSSDAQNRLSPWHIACSPDDLMADTVREQLEAGRRVIIAVDDITDVLEGNDTGHVEGLFDELLDTAQSHPLRFVIAGEADAIGRCYSNSITRIRSDRTGILLQPDIDIHGALLGTVLGRRDELAGGVGQGWIINSGVAQPIQVAVDDTH